jgi:hypothetical protein
LNRSAPRLGIGSLVIDHLFLTALAMRKIFFGRGVAMPARKELPMTDLMLNDDQELVRICATNIAGFLMARRVAHGDDRWFTVPEVAEALNLTPAATIAVLAFKQVSGFRIIEKRDGSMRYIGGR